MINDIQALLSHSLLFHLCNCLILNCCISATAAAETITEAAAAEDTEITTITTEVEETIIATITEMIAVEAVAVAAEIVVDVADRDRFQRNPLTQLM